ncbi:MAG: hypothetical protein EXS22_08595 [Pedosphaera sp.]|nr:hypothetical protein [Pedosphaera sp.]MSU44080.1 hypothetical protein [Pedosphaera sp.]
MPDEKPASTSPSTSAEFKIKKEISRKEIALCMARVPESGRVYIGTSDSGVYEIDTVTEKAEPKKCEGEGHTGYVMGAALTETHLVTGAYDKHLVWWDLKTGKQTRRQSAHEKWLRGVEVSPDGKTIASVADDMVCRLWKADSGELIRELRGHAVETPHHYPSMLYCCAFSPDGAWLATADKVGQIVVWERSSGKPAKTLQSPGMYTWDPKQRRHSIGGIRSIRFSPDSKTLAVGGVGFIGNIDHLDGKARVELFDWQQGTSLKVIESDKQKGLVEHMAFHPKGDWLLCAGGDHSGWLVFIDPKTQKVVREDKAPMHVHEFALSEKADQLYTVGHGRVVRWELSA